MSLPNTWNFLMASTPVVSITLLVLYRQRGSCKAISNIFGKIAKVLLYLALITSLINLFWSSYHKASTHVTEPAMLSFVGIVAFGVSNIMCQHTWAEAVCTILLALGTVFYAIRGSWRSKISATAPRGAPGIADAAGTAAPKSL